MTAAPGIENEPLVGPFVVTMEDDHTAFETVTAERVRTESHPVYNVTGRPVVDDVADGVGNRVHDTDLAAGHPGRVRVVAGTPGIRWSFGRGEDE